MPFIKNTVQDGLLHTKRYTNQSHLALLLLVILCIYCSIATSADFSISYV